jgi:LCP family protein required for cell wall assembly
VTGLVGSGLGWAVRSVVPPTKLGIGPSLDERMNVAVIAVDPVPMPPQPGDKATRRVADVVHVFSLDIKHHTGFVLSMPRQTFVVLGNEPASLSDVLAFGGAARVKSTVEDVTGLPINAHVTMDVEALKSVLGTGGNTDVFMPKAVKFADAPSGLSLDVKEGWQSLSPEQALAYAWWRPDGDELARLDRQQMLMHEWQARANHPMAFMWFNRAVERGLSLATTDLPKRDFEHLAGELAKIHPDRMTYATIPGEVSPHGSWVPSTKRLESLISKLMVSPTDKSIAEAKPTVEILYDDKSDQKVMALATQLTDQGFQVIRTSRYPVSQVESKLVDRAKLELRSQPVLEALDHAVGGVRVVLAPDETNVYGAQYTLELGKGFFR